MCQECNTQSCGTNCQCLACQKGIEFAQKDEAEKMAKYGWIVHFTTDQSDIHTHGLVEKYNHPDLQIAFPLPPQIAHQLLHNTVKRIEKGEKFEIGEDYSEIAGQGYKVRFVQAIESDRVVLRMIIPPANGELDRHKMNSELFEKQYLCTITAMQKKREPNES